MTIDEAAAMLIESHGSLAYKEAVKLSTLAVHVGDKEGAQLMADAAIKLMQLGYHKHDV